MLSEIRGKEEQEHPPEEKKLLSELDPMFKDENGNFSPAKWRDYISDNHVNIRKKRFVPKTNYEVAVIRLVNLVIKWCRYVEASEYRIWPRNADGSSPGTPWEQPHWRLSFMESFWGGAAKVREEREKASR